MFSWVHFRCTLFFLLFFLFFCLIFLYYYYYKIIMSLSLASASLIGSGIGVGSNILGSFISSRNERRMLDRQNAYNVDMWNMNNAYNTPEAQMERLKRAGLNPNLMYGTGHAATGNSASAPQQTAYVSNAVADSVRSSGQSIMQAFDNYLNFKQREQNLDNTKVNNEILVEQKKRIAAEAKIAEHDAEVITGETGGVTSKSKYSDIYNFGRRVWNWFNEKDKEGKELIEEIEKIYPSKFR